MNTDKDRDAPIKFSGSDYITSITHFYRAEMDRVNAWRARLDVTTNWAIVTTAAFLSVGFGSKEIPHFVIILATIFVLFFLIIEARRYKYYDLWRWRVELISQNFFATINNPKGYQVENWEDLINHDLRNPTFKISTLEAFGRRLRRNYIWIFVVLAICWVMKISIHPTPARQFSEIFSRAAIFQIVPGWIVITVGLLFNFTLLLIAFLSLKKRSGLVSVYPKKKPGI